MQGYYDVYVLVQRSVVHGDSFFGRKRVPVTVALQPIK